MGFIETSPPCCGAAGEAEFRELPPQEVRVLQACCGRRPATVDMLDAGVLLALYRKSLVYFNVPVRDDDRFSIPPLEVRGGGCSCWPGPGTRVLCRR